MATGDLTAQFGDELVALLSDRLSNAWPGFDPAGFAAATGPLDPLNLKQRIDAIADGLAAVLPKSPDAVAEIMLKSLPRPLTDSEQTFNDGWWMLPLAQCWPRHALSHPDVALPCLRELTQRGTAEFAVRGFAMWDPSGFADVQQAWAADPSFHVRRLASEGTRPYLPWSGKLRVPREAALRFLEPLAVLARDVSSYVRRSAGNHVRDWRRIDPAVADQWIAEHDPPPDVLKLALPRKPKQK